VRATKAALTVVTSAKETEVILRFYVPYLRFERGAKLLFTKFLKWRDAINTYLLS